MASTEAVSTESVNKNYLGIPKAEFLVIVLYIFGYINVSGFNDLIIGCTALQVYI